MTLKPGEIYFADYGEMEPHRVIVISREEFNRGKYVNVVLCTSKRFRERSMLSNCVVFRAGEYGFTTDCVAQCETMSFVEVRDIQVEEGPIGKLDEEDMRNLIRAVGYVMGAECESE